MSISIALSPSPSDTVGSTKTQVYDFWTNASCGENLYLAGTHKEGYLAHSAARYALEEKEISELAQFDQCQGKEVLEIGVGLGADHQRFAEAGARLHGIDLTDRAVEHTSRRFDLFGYQSKLATGDAENLSFSDDTFDVVYSWGVLHHSPDTAKAIREVWRVLKPGGEAKIMIYHKWSMVGLMLWGRYGLLTLQPWTSLKTIYGKYLESPGTKAYSVREARSLFAQFTSIKVGITLGHADLMSSPVGQRHQGMLLRVARRLWPRWFIRRYLPWAGLTMTIRATK